MSIQDILSPTRQIIKKEETKNVTVDIDLTSIRARSNTYLCDRKDGYVDTTYYDKKDKSLDIGYQRLRKLNLQNYPSIKNIKVLLVDNNLLTELPDGDNLPHLERLSCSSNKLTSIPFYPNLTSLIAANNSITSLGVYCDTPLEYLDCSYNKMIDIHFKLPQCTHLFIAGCQLEHLKLKNYPRLQFLDCSNNLLKEINSHSKLIELDAKYNLLEGLPSFPLVKHLFVSHNQITKIPKFPLLENLTADHNKIDVIGEIPKLKYLSISYNQIKKSPKFPLLEHGDFSHNRIEEIVFTPKIQHILLFSNPITRISINPSVFGVIKEIQVGYPGYLYFYDKYHENIDVIDIQVSQETALSYLDKLKGALHNYPTERIYKQFLSVNFKLRHDDILLQAREIYAHIFPEVRPETGKINHDDPKLNKLFSLVKLDALDIPEKRPRFIKMMEILFKLRDKYVEKKITYQNFNHFLYSIPLVLQEMDENLPTTSVLQQEIYDSIRHVYQDYNSIIHTDSPDLQVLYQNLLKIYHKSLVICLYFNRYYE